MEPTPKALTPQQNRERIRNIAQPDGFTFFAEPTGAEQLYLGSPEDVAFIVREFCGAVYDIRSRVTMGKVEGAAAVAKLDELANEYAGIFYGRQPERYRPMPFNSPAGVGKFIIERMGLKEEPDQAGYVLFMNTANQILEAYEGHMTGAMDEGTVQFRIEAAIEDTTGILLGLPPEE